MKAVWQETFLAQSDQTITVEGNHYFPPNSIHKEYFDQNETHSTCPWKGKASYYHLRVGQQSNPDAAWYYPEPKDAAKSIQGYIAFWRGVKVLDRYSRLSLHTTTTMIQFVAWPLLPQLFP